MKNPASFFCERIDYPMSNYFLKNKEFTQMAQMKRWIEKTK